MTPTNRLRFVEREETFDGFSVDDHPVGRTVRVLQQWWDAEEGDHEDYVKAGGEWRDVPLDGPGQLPDLAAAKKEGGAQCMFNREMAEHEAFRAAHPAACGRG